MGQACDCWKDERTREIDNALNDKSRKDKNVIKLLFLGAGGSGKSTLFKQLRLLHGKGFDVNERALYKTTVHNNIISNLKTLSEGVVDDLYAKNPGPESKEEEDQPSEEDAAHDLIAAIENLELIDRGNIDEKTAESLSLIWNSPEIQKKWADHNNVGESLQIQECIEYYMQEKNLKRICSPDYLPTEEDILRVRARTTGVVEETLRIKNRDFQIVDVGGQRSERKKWINCFNEVTGIIYVASLIGYDQTLLEDDTTFRMKESLQVFKDLNEKHHETFKNAMIILFLNKSDLFEHKIQHQNITICFKEYKGPHTEEDCYNYIKDQFLKYADRGSRTVTVHKTCATSTQHMKHIFDGVNHQIINRALLHAGLLVQ